MSKLFLTLFVMVSTLAFASVDCEFCDQESIKNQVVYEDDLVQVFYHQKPLLAGHCTIATKRHAERFEDLSKEEIVAMFDSVKALDLASAKTYGTTAYFLLERNGIEAGQDIPHVHFHYVPRRANDVSDFGLLVRFVRLKSKKPIKQAEMDRNRDALMQNWPI